MVEIINNICREIVLTANRISHLASATLENDFAKARQETPKDIEEQIDTVSEMFADQTVDELEHLQREVIALTGFIVEPADADETDDNGDEGVVAEGDLDDDEEDE